MDLDLMAIVLVNPRAIETVEPRTQGTFETAETRIILRSGRKINTNMTGYEFLTYVEQETL
jgi:hypothetical protein